MYLIICTYIYINHYLSVFFITARTSKTINSPKGFGQKVADNGK